MYEFVAILAAFITLMIFFFSYNIREGDNHLVN